MLLISCPWCGSREEAEFHWGGQAHVTSPTEPDERTDEEWAAYLYVRDNPRGVTEERWVHASGCRRWFNAIRDTTTHSFLAFYKPGEEPPVRLPPPIEELR